MSHSQNTRLGFCTLVLSNLKKQTSKFKHVTMTLSVHYWQCLHNMILTLAQTYSLQSQQRFLAQEGEVAASGDMYRAVVMWT